MASPTHGFARAKDSIDAQLGTLVALQRETAEQLASTRKQLAELAAHELTLLQQYGAREKRLDLLLDERLLAMAVEQVAV